MPSEWLSIALLTLLAGAAMPIGAILASVEKIRPRWLEDEVRHSIIAFGGGALLSAIALVLIPDGSKGRSSLFVAFWFSAGGLLFMLLDMWLASRKGGASQLVAMLSDFVPEALALGAAFVHNHNTGVLLALIMTLQNLPEGFNAYRELSSSTKLNSKHIILAFTLMSLLGPAAGLSGYFFLSSAPNIVSAIMLFSAGGILYLIFQDIAPQVKLKRHWAPPMGAVAGFLLGLLGHMFTN